MELSFTSNKYIVVRKKDNHILCLCTYGNRFEDPKRIKGVNFIKVYHLEATALVAALNHVNSSDDVIIKEVVCTLKERFDDNENN